MKGKTLVIHKVNDIGIPTGIYTIKTCKKTSGGFGHGTNDYYPPYKTYTIQNRLGDLFCFRDGCHVKNHLPIDSYKIL